MGEALSVEELLVEKVSMEVVHIAESLDARRTEEQAMYELCRGKLNKADSNDHYHFVRSIHGS
jgi:hypothetical protein